MSDIWSQREVEAIVADYFAMWKEELRGLNFNKAEHNRYLQKLFRGRRSRGSIERKHQNISAVLWHLEAPYISGYKPLANYQRLLRAVVEEQLAQETGLKQLISKNVEKPVKIIPPLRSLRAIQVPPPSRKEVKKLVREEGRHKTTYAPRNYIEEEAKNQSLGCAGEEFILRFEHERLWKLGKRKLANRVQHISKTKGDYFGFDISSFESNGRDRLIEVKTTRFAPLTRFFASAKELEVSELRKDMYHLYRLFDFDRQPKFFVLSGSLHDTCEMKPATFWVVPA